MTKISRRQILKYGVAGASLGAGAFATRSLANRWLTQVRVEFAIEELQQSVAALGGGNTKIGFCMIDAGTGDRLAEFAADQAMTCGSLRKLFLVAASLIHLGPEFRFTTQVVADSATQLRLIGGGDPTLTQESLKSLAERVVSGWHTQASLVTDGSLFTPPKRYGSDQDTSDFPSPRPPGFYARQLLGQVCALGVDRGVRTAFAAPSPKVGEPAIVSVRGGISPFELVNRTSTSDSETNCQIFREPHSNRLLAQGTVGLNDVGFGVAALLDPGLDAANHLARAVTDLRGPKLTTIAGQNQRSVPNASLIATHSSAPLREYVQQLLKKSDGLLAESLVRILGASESGRGDAAEGCKLEQKLLQGKNFDYPSHGFQDGSGLDHSTEATAREVCQLLLQMKQYPRKEVATSFVSALATPGEEGTTLAKRFSKAIVRSRVRAKTGTLMNSHSLAGYLTCLSGREVCFAVMLVPEETVSEGKARAAIDLFVTTLIGGN